MEFNEDFEAGSGEQLNPLHTLTLIRMIKAIAIDSVRYRIDISKNRKHGSH